VKGRAAPGTRFIIHARQLHPRGTNGMSKAGVPRQLSEKEVAMLRTHMDRQARYLRTAYFVQSKWFMIGGALAIAVFLTILFLVT
jgi:hypothetical protein